MCLITIEVKKKKKPITMAAESRSVSRGFNYHFTCSRVPSLAYLECADFKKPGVFAPGIFPSDIAVNNPPCAIARKISIGGAIY